MSALLLGFLLRALFFGGPLFFGNSHIGNGEHSGSKDRGVDGSRRVELGLSAVTPVKICVDGFQLPKTRLTASEHSSKTTTLEHGSHDNRPSKDSPYICIYIYICVYIYVYTDVHLRIHMYIYIYIRITHTHTRSLSLSLSLSAGESP